MQLKTTREIMFRMMSFVLPLCRLIGVGVLIIILFVNETFASEKVASVGKYEISKQEAELASKIAGLGSFDRLSIDAQKAIVQKLIHDKVLEDQAKKEGINEQIEVAMTIRSILVSKYIEKHSSDLEFLAKKRYDEIVLALKDKKNYTLSHILVEDEAEANKIYRTVYALKNWKPEFKKIAKEKSIDRASAENGGALGTVAEIKLPKEFLKHIQDAKVDILIKPFKTHLGYHIVTIEKVEPMYIEPYENVRAVFMGEVLQKEIERLATEQLKGKEIEYELDNEK